MRVVLVLTFMTCAAGAATASEFRDEQGRLNLRDCAMAAAWLAAGPGTAGDNDPAYLLDAAIKCAREDGAVASRLLALAALGKQPALPEWQAHLETRRAQALLALERSDEALKLAASASARLLAPGLQCWDAEGAQMTLMELAALHEGFAETDHSGPDSSAAHRKMAERLLQAAMEPAQSVDNPSIRDFHDLYGDLKLPSCGAARRWLDIRRPTATSSDSGELDSAARLCAIDSQRDSAQRLLKVVDGLPADDHWVSAGYDGSLRATVLLQLEDWGAASEALRTTSTALLDAIAKHPEELDSTVVLTDQLSSKNIRLAAQLEEREPQQALELYQLGVRLADVHGSPEAAGALLSALRLALKTDQVDTALELAHGLLDRKLSADDALVRHYTSALGALLVRLDDAGREAEMLALAKKMRSSRWPDAVKIADGMLQHHDR